jgi:hypothetical protein
MLGGKKSYCRAHKDDTLYCEEKCKCSDIKKYEVKIMRVLRNIYNPNSGKGS